MHELRNASAGIKSARREITFASRPHPIDAPDAWAATDLVYQPDDRVLAIGHQLL